MAIWGRRGAMQGGAPARAERNQQSPTPPCRGGASQWQLEGVRGAVQGGVGPTAHRATDLQQVGGAEPKVRDEHVGRREAPASAEQEWCLGGTKAGDDAEQDAEQRGANGALLASIGSSSAAP